MIKKDSVEYGVLKSAVDNFGEKKQMHKLQNELCELASEIGKYVEGRCVLSELIDEMADVFITLNYPLIVFDENFENNLKERIKFKIDRLANTIISERIANNASIC
jgi:NTP pyrophosphatase (non-canonical NTP hydrolase)